MSKSAIAFHQELTEAAAKSSQEVRRHPEMQIGQVGHQGDVYIHRIAKAPAAWLTEVSEHRQVAVGDTIGSRHIADGPKLRVLWPASREAAVKDCPIRGFIDTLGLGAEFCLGPIVESSEPWALTHPEHAHHEFPAGTYLVTYQLDRQQMRAVRD